MTKASRRRKRKRLPLLLLYASILIIIICCVCFSSYILVYFTSTTDVITTNNPSNVFFETRSTKHRSSPPKKRFFDLSNPPWPRQPPSSLSVPSSATNDNSSNSNDCHIVFRDPGFYLCHVIPWGANFGDEMGPPVVKRILELYYGNDNNNCSADDLPVFDIGKHLGWDYMNRSKYPKVQTCFMTVGSLFRVVQTGDHLWGTGVVYDTTVRDRCHIPSHRPHPIENLTIYSTRGPLSASHIMRHCKFAQRQQHHWKQKQEEEPYFETAGDPGFLIPFLFPEYVVTNSSAKNNNKSKKTCIIPHHADRNKLPIKAARNDNNNNSTMVVLTVQQSWENMTLTLQRECSEVISSSLHGIILAEALGIPNRRLRLSKTPGDFKFDDFHASYRGGTNQPQAPLKWVRDISEAVRDVMVPLPFSDRDQYARRILKSFPIHLFQAVKNAPTIPTKSSRSVS